MKNPPRIVIVGFPNVGKSTLFNRLAGKRKALVHNQPGMTRDCLEERTSILGRRVTLVDTGGLFGVEDEPLSARARKSAWREVVKADLIVFMVDARRELSPVEEGLLDDVRKVGVPVILVVNKVDSQSHEPEAAGFYSLGVAETLFVSAEHKYNLDLLEEVLAASLPGRPAEEVPAPVLEAEESMESEEKPVKPAGEGPLKIAIVGRINVGKSSIVNRLLGEERLLVSDIPGTTRDSADTLITREGRHYSLIDTAGIRKMSGTKDSREKAGIIRSKANIQRADVVCLVMDAVNFPTRQDARIAQLTQDSGRPLLIVLNKWDLVNKEAMDTEAAKDILFGRMNFVNYAPLLFVSAKSGQRVVKILEMAEVVHLNATRRIETSKLNVFLRRISEDQPPRLENGTRAKMKYITQKSACPPSFILFTGSRGRLSKAYEKYLADALREEFGLIGTPIRITMRSR